MDRRLGKAHAVAYRVTSHTLQLHQNRHSECALPPKRRVSTIGTDERNEPASELDVARAEVAQAEAEMKVAAARLRLAKADAERRARVEEPSDPDRAPDGEADDVARVSSTPVSPIMVPADDQDTASEAGTESTAETDDADGESGKSPGTEAGNGSSALGRRRMVWISFATFVVVVVVAVVVGVLLRGADEETSPAGSADLGEDVALRLDGTRVSEAELANRVQVLSVLYGVEVPTDPDELDTFRRDTAESLASSIVIDQAAREQGLAVSADDVDATLDRYLQSRYADNRLEAFSQELGAKGITEQDVRDEISRQLNGQQLFLDVTADIDVTESEAREAYQDDPRSWAQPEQRQLRYIALPHRVAAQRVLTTLRRGGDFATVARRQSADASTRDTGGELGLVTADQLDPAFARRAFQAAKGALFGPVETGQGWYVGQVQRVIAARSSYGALRKSIVDGLSSDRALRLWTDYVAQTTAEASITYAADYQPSADDESSPTEGPGGVPTAPESGSPSAPTPTAAE